MSSSDLDVAIVGGGPAGLSAAFWLARYRREVRVYDTGEPRNEPTWAVHGYPGLPDTPPLELRRKMREQAIGAGAEVELRSVESLQGEKDSFLLTLQGGERITARRVILAYGRQDLLPPIPGLEAHYGRSVFHCPDCDGPSMLGVRLGVVGWDRPAGELALYLQTWADSVALLANGQEIELNLEQREKLARLGVTLYEQPVVKLVERDGLLEAIELAGGEALEVGGLFFHLGSLPASRLAEQATCEHDEHGYVCTDRSGETTVPGLFATGDITGHPHLVVSAAAEGVTAALAIHRSLLPHERRL